MFIGLKKALTQRLFTPKFGTIGVIGLFTGITVAFGGFVVCVRSPMRLDWESAFWRQ